MLVRFICSKESVSEREEEPGLVCAGSMVLAEQLSELSHGRL